VRFVEKACGSAGIGVFGWCLGLPKTSQGILKRPVPSDMAFLARLASTSVSADKVHVCWLGKS
jgi:hypothetical protein